MEKPFFVKLHWQTLVETYLNNEELLNKYLLTQLINSINANKLYFTEVRMIFWEMALPQYKQIMENNRFFLMMSSNGSINPLDYDKLALYKTDFYIKKFVQMQEERESKRKK